MEVSCLWICITVASRYHRALSFLGSLPCSATYFFLLCLGGFLCLQISSGINPAGERGGKQSLRVTSIGGCAALRAEEAPGSE